MKSPIIKKIVVLLGFAFWQMFFFASFNYVAGNTENKTLSQNFPHDTLLYIQVDIKQAVKHFSDYLSFLDKETGQDIIKQVHELQSVIKDYARVHQFKPALFNEIQSSKFYYVGFYMNKPVLTEKSYYTYNYDKQTKKVKRVEKKYTEKEELNFSFILESNAEVAQNFIHEFKALMERMRDKSPDNKEFDWKQVEVDDGELLKNKDGFLGRLGRYLIFSKYKPEKVWRYLQYPADQSLSETKLYKRYRTDRIGSQGMMLFNLGKYLWQEEKTMLGQVKQLKRNSPQNNNSKARVDWRLKRAEANLKFFQLFKKMFSFDKLKFVGANFGLNIKGNVLKTGYTFSLSHLEPISPFLQAVLNSGQPFQDPGIGIRDYIAFLFRMQIKDMRKIILKSMDHQSVAQSNMANFYIKKQIGYSIDEILEKFSGDMYLFYKEKDLIVEDDEKLPEFFVFFGMNDGVSFSEMLSTIFTNASVNLGFGNSIEKRVYQQTNVYLFGPGKGLAIVVLGRYVSIGSWNGIKKLIRKIKAGNKPNDNQLLKIIRQFRNSNLLFIVSNSYIKSDLKSNQSRVKEIIGNIEQGFKITDKEFEDRFKKVLVKLLMNMSVLQKRTVNLNPKWIIFNGAHSKQLYELGTKVEIKK